MTGTAEIASSRTFAASPEELFAAFADPARLARWWGPRGARNEFHEFDLRPGGRWRLTMHMPDGAAHTMEKTFLEVDAPRRVLLHHGQAGHDFTHEMRYHPVPGGTRLVWRVTFARPEQLLAVQDAFAQGNEENFDRLAAELR